MDSGDITSVKRNLLIVDDEPLILKLLKFNLEDYAQNIYTALDGEQGLQILRNETVDCVVSDINMPVMNGMEMLKQIRKEQNPVPFIFYTAHGSLEHMQEAAALQTFDFLNKPNIAVLEEILIRGLREGFIHDGKGTISEYRKILGKDK